MSEGPHDSSRDELIDQVIGQERAVEVVRKAAEQRRHVMLIGDPGTGKSMLARSMTELLPHEPKPTRR